MADIKLKNSQGEEIIYEGVYEIKLKDKDSNDVQGFFPMDHMTTFVKDTGVIHCRQDNNAGVPTTIPTEPTKEGFWFMGWSEVSHDYSSANKVVLPAVFDSNKTLYAMWIENPNSAASVVGLGNEVIGSITYNVGENFPSSFEEVNDAYGNVFIKIPTMYRKINDIVSGQITSITVATNKVDDSFVPYSCFVRPNGTIAPYILIGKYLMSDSNVAKSVEATAIGLQIDAARELARQRGSGYQLYDWQIRQLINDLIVINKRTVKINDATIFGSTGWDANIWIDGFCHNSTDLLVCYDPSKYVNEPTENTAGYSKLSYSFISGSAAYIKKLGYDSDHPFAQFPTEAGGTENTYYPDQANPASVNRPFYCYVGLASANNGLFNLVGSGQWTSANRCRLCYRP